jgi:hypothetical protein
MSLVEKRVIVALLVVAAAVVGLWAAFVPVSWYKISRCRDGAEHLLWHMPTPDAVDVVVLDRRIGAASEPATPR